MLSTWLRRGFQTPILSHLDRQRHSCVSPCWELSWPRKHTTCGKWSWWCAQQRKGTALKYKNRLVSSQLLPEAPAKQLHHGIWFLECTGKTASHLMTFQVILNCSFLSNASNIGTETMYFPAVCTRNVLRFRKSSQWLLYLSHWVMEMLALPPQRELLCTVLTDTHDSVGSNKLNLLILL